MVSQELQNRMNEIKNGMHKFNFSESFNQGWKIFGKGAGPYIGGFFIYMVGIVIINFIPLIGGITVSFVITPMYLCGFYFFTNEIIKGGAPDFNNLFNYKPLGKTIVVNLIYNIGLAVLIFIIVIIFFASKFKLLREIFERTKLNGGAAKMDPSEAMELFGPFFGMVLVILLIALIIGIFLFYRNHFAILTDSFMESFQFSMQIGAKNFFPILGFLIVWGLILLVSAAPCGLGLIATIPAFTASVGYSFYDMVLKGKESLKPTELNSDGVLDA